MECHVSAENARLKEKCKEAEANAERWRRLFGEKSDMNIRWVEDWSAKLRRMKIDGDSLEEQMICLVKRDEEAIRILIEIQGVILEMKASSRIANISHQDMQMMSKFLDKVENG